MKSVVVVMLMFPSLEMERMSLEKKEVNMEYLKRVNTFWQEFLTISLHFWPYQHHIH